MTSKLKKAKVPARTRLRLAREEHVTSAFSKGFEAPDVRDLRQRAGDATLALDGAGRVELEERRAAVTALRSGSARTETISPAWSPTSRRASMGWSGQRR